MTIELKLLAWTLILALVHVMAAAGARNREVGLAYNAGNRDADAPPPGIVTARLMRAQANFYESLPLFIAAVLIAAVANVHTETTVLGAELFLGARILYLPIYALGVPYVRTLVWAAGLVGILLIVWTVLSAV